MDNVFFSARFFRAVLPYIGPLAGPNIAKKGWPLLGKALGRVWEGFGKFCAFWKGFARVLRMFCACFAHVLEKAKLSSRDQVGC